MTYLPQKVRLTHPDQVRGVAILLMIMVHAAATWTPASISKTSTLAFIVSGLGGLAAPLFITLVGWGVAKSKLTPNKIIIRSSFLLVGQLIVNICAPHLFKPFTPGVLSLIALIILFAPIWLGLVRYKTKSGAQLWVPIITITLFLPAVFPTIFGPSQWGPRVEASTISSVISHSFLTGTYPLIPWLSFAIIGALIADGKTQNSQTFFLIGVTTFLSFVIYSSISSKELALPHGDAIMTFFPANTPFLISATLGVGIIWEAMKKVPAQQALINLGQRSLTIYILHFLPFSLLHNLDENGNWSATFCAVIVLIYTLMWLPLAHLHAKHIPNLSLEKLLRNLQTKT